MKAPHSFAAALAAVALVGCTDVSSTDLKTSGITAYFTVTANGTGNTNASAELQVKDSSTITFVELQSGDQLTATTGGQSKTLEESKTLGVISYNATFTGADAEGTSYTFALQRSADTSASGNTVTLPAPFSITAPTGATLSYSRANDDIVVDYDNAQKSDSMSFTLSGDCIEIMAGSPPGDTGSFTIAKGSLVQRQGAATSCQVVLTLMRSRSGTLDPAFGAGLSTAVQARSFTFTSNP